MISHDREHFSTLSGPSGVTWTKDIKQLFNETDIDHMKTKGIDLSSYNDVKINAVAIYGRVKSGSMPPPPLERWTDDMVNIFGLWIQQGTPE